MSPNLEAHFDKAFLEKTTRSAFNEQIQRLRSEISPEYVFLLDQYASQVFDVIGKEASTIVNDNLVKVAVLQETNKIGANLIAATRKRGKLIRDITIQTTNDNWGPDKKAA